MKAKFYKRCLAFIIDIIIVLLISSVIVGFIPMSKVAKKKSDELLKYYNEITNDKEVELNEKTLDKLLDLQYEYDKETIIYSIVTITISVIYYVVYQLKSGSTLGKKLMNIKLKSNNSNKLDANRVVFRCLLINNIGFNIILTIIMMFFSKNVYFSLAGFIEIFNIIFIIISIFMSAIRKDGRGLHDLIGNTIVVEKS